MAARGGGCELTTYMQFYKALNFRLAKKLLVLLCFCGGSILAACNIQEGGEMATDRKGYRTGRLTATPNNQQLTQNVKTGIQPLNLDSRKDGLIYVPASYSAGRPAALAVMLHGAGGSAEQGMSLLRKFADDNNIILIAPASRAMSWDIISNDSFGPDVIYIEQALKQTFEQYAIDTAHVAIGGFSDGASYALSLGLTNGDLFTHVLAFSPGFAHTVEQHGKPTVYISHGTEDAVLPIGPCSRRIVPQLQLQGIQVNYQEFDGPHTVPASIAEAGINWFLAK